MSELRPPANEANSFQLFLCLVYSTIATGSRQGEGEVNTIWRQLKGRFVEYPVHISPWSIPNYLFSGSIPNCIVAGLLREWKLDCREFCPSC